jgi:hypothetical protein
MAWIQGWLLSAMSNGSESVKGNASNAEIDDRTDK